MKQRRKKTKRVRTRDWEDVHEDAFSHDLKRHLRTDTPITTVAAPERQRVDFEANGTVISHSKKWARVLVDGQEILCGIHEGLMEDRVTLLVPGDRVLVAPVGDQPVVQDVKPRRTKLCRLALEDARLEEQVVAANIDVLLIVVATKRPALKPGLVDRYLITAQTGGVTPILCVNKMDLVDREPEEIAAYRDLGAIVVNTSCETGTGVETLRDLLRDRLSVLSGQSGVGKSSLLNALDNSLDIATTEVSGSTQKGRHTTSASRLYQLEGNIGVIDTPGVRQLGLWGVSPEEVAFYFPEIAEHAGNCRFRNCTHIHEPECAVRNAVDEAALPALRYQSYLRIRSSLEDPQKSRP